MALFKCVECKSDVSNKAEICPKCGCPLAETISEHKKKKKKIIYTSIIVLLLASVVVWSVGKVMSIPDKSGYYNGISWGTSSKDILAQLPDSARLSENQETIFANEEDFCGLSGIDAVVMYELEEDSLVKVVILLSNPQSSSFTAGRIIKLISDYYDEQYGEHEEDIISAVWKTKNSKIELINMTEALIYLTFSDANFVEPSGE